jgi:hypothetical protein
LIYFNSVKHESEISGFIVLRLTIGLQDRLRRLGIGILVKRLVTTQVVATTTLVKVGKLK